MMKIEFTAVFTVCLAAPGLLQAQSSQKWKFDPTINAPWAMENYQKPLDTSAAAAGLCRSNPFNTLFAYAALGSSNPDAITGDAAISTDYGQSWNRPPSGTG
ncbi:MAG TPA: hypothetical protein VJ732_18640 [Bryobacteraceae bacterium]|nr:hypothetical protein [Bryobacteraceae bacterium]